MAYPISTTAADYVKFNVYQFLGLKTVLTRLI